MGFSNFLSNLKRSLKERNALVRQSISLQKQYDQMMKELEGNIKNAETKEEKERLVSLKQQIIDEGKKVENELKNKR